MADMSVLTGMILRSAPAGEYDRRITLLTKEQGKITAFARGARRPKSALGAATGLFCFGTFEAYEGREAWTVVRAQIRNYFPEFSADYELTCWGSYFLELADYFTRPGSEAARELALLYQSLRALCSKSLEHRLVCRIYELKTLVLFGVAPDVYSCGNCHSRENLISFSVRRRAVLCGSCAAGEGCEQLLPATIYTLQYIVSSPVEKLYTFRVSEEVYRQISRIIREYLAQYIDKNLKTRAFLPE